MLEPEIQDQVSLGHAPSEGGKGGAFLSVQLLSLPWLVGASVSSLLWRHLGLSFVVS